MKQAGIAPPRNSAGYSLIHVTLLLVALIAPAGVFAATGQQDVEPMSPAGENSGLLDSLSAFGRKLGLVGEQQRFLDPDRAFIFSADIVDGNTIAAHWQIADGYYMYRDKLAFRVIEPENVQIGQHIAPPGKIKDDETFGKSEVYYHDLAVALPVTRTTLAPVTVTLEARYQGCADAGFCYSPITKSTRLLLPAAVAVGGIRCSSIHPE